MRYVVCDTCGYLEEVADDHTAESCSNCSHDALWEFPFRENAALHSLLVLDRVAGVQR